MSDNPRIQLFGFDYVYATAACRFDIDSTDSNAQQPEPVMVSESRIDDQYPQNHREMELGSHVSPRSVGVSSISSNPLILSSMMNSAHTLIDSDLIDTSVQDKPTAAECRPVIVVPQGSNAQQPEVVSSYYSAPLSSEMEDARSEMAKLSETRIESCRMVEELAEGFEKDFLITRELMAQWKAEGATLFFEGKVVPHEDGDGDFAFEFADFIREDDRWIACSAHRCLGALEACGYSWAPHCAYVRFNKVAANYVVTNLLKQQRGIRNVVRFLVQYHGGERVPLRVVHHVVETMNRLYPLELSMYITSVTATNYHKRVPVFVQSEDREFFEVVNDWYSIVFSAQATRDVECANRILHSITPTYAEAQGAVGALWDIIATAVSAVTKTLTSVTQVGRALVSSFLHHIVDGIFKILVIDSFPFNAAASVFGIINAVFKPLHERFSELIDFTTESVTPSSFLEAMNSGTTGQKISRWALGAVSFGVLAWILYRLAVFTEAMLTRIITSLYDAVNITGAYPEPFVTSQGPDSGMAPSVNILSVVITLSLADRKSVV